MEQGIETSVNVHSTINPVCFVFQLPAGAVSMFAGGVNPLTAALKKQRPASDSEVRCVLVLFFLPHFVNIIVQW